MTLGYFTGYDATDQFTDDGVELISGGRGGGQCMHFTKTAGAYADVLSLNAIFGFGLTDDPSRTLYVGRAVKRSTSPSGCLLLAFSNSTFTPSFVLGDDGDIEVWYRYDTGSRALLGTATAALPSPSVWYYMEVCVYNSTTAGTVEIRITTPGGTPTVVLTLTGLDLRINENTGNLRLGPELFEGAETQVDCDLYFDDLYVLNAAGTINNTYLGDVSMPLLRTVGDGAGTSLLRSDTGFAAWQLVNDIPPDDDTTYLYHNGAFSFVGGTSEMDDITVGSSSDIVPGVNYIGWFRHVYAFAGDIPAYLVLAEGGSSTSFNTGNVGAGPDYVKRVVLYETDPNMTAGTQWTVGQVNDTEAGATFNFSPGTGHQMRVTAYCLEVILPFVALARAIARIQIIG